jgi:Ig-like domain from next to BRCA1 gene
VPDGTVFAAGAAFTKTWRLRNIGNCTWTTSYSLVFDTGNSMGGPTSVNLPNSVAPGQTVDISINLTAPSSAGHYIGYWKFKNASGVLFGIGYNANRPWWVEINVSGSSGTGVAYDFAANYCSASWYSIQGSLPCPGTDGDSRGFVLKVDKPQLENGAFDTGSGLITMPQNSFNGDIHGIYPAFHVQYGDRFQSIVNCAYGATSCYVTLRLDYQIGNGPINTLWTWREKYEGLYYRTNVDLSALAGQDVKFILTVLATGSSVGDRALWSNPVILRAGATPPPTPIPGTVTPTPIPPASCDRAQFIADVTVPDGTNFVPGATFTKTWRLRNVGSCTWTTSYALIFDTGSQMGGPSSVNLPNTVLPGQTVDLSINLTAPSAGGSYRGYWKFKNANGVPFGIGADGTKSWWVDIRVSGPTPTPVTSTPGTPYPTATPVAGVMYDFAANACSGVWYSGVGQLPCPGTDGDAKGFVLKVASPQLENGTVDPRQGLVTYPQNTFNGYIQGIFPPYHVKPGDRFRSIVNCAYGATSCYVVFRLDYQTGTSPITTFWAFVEKYEGQYYQADLDLSPLVGQDIKFILTVNATGSPVGDRALWVAPMIYNASSIAPTAAPTLVPTLTPTPATAVPSATPAATTSGSNTTGWNTYQNSKFGFSFQFPPGSAVSGQTDNAGHITLPFAAGTNLQEKYLDVSVVEDASSCKSPQSTAGATSENITINGTPFLKESGSQGAAGNFYDWVGYSAFKGTDCISLTFVLHSTDPGVYPTMPPIFDKTAESAVFSTIMSTFVNQ